LENEETVEEHTPMKAVRLEATGQLYLRDVEKPVPGPDDLLVRIEACGICGTDRHLFLGEFPAKPPVTLGHEFAGLVEAVGSGVTDFRPGMRITGDPNIACGRCPECQRGRVNLCRNLRAIGIHRDGGFAEYVIVPQKQAFVLPADLDPLHGAFCEPLACCLHGVDLAAIDAGSSVVVLGGGVIGLLVVQLVRLAGATRVVLVTRSAEKRRGGTVVILGVMPQGVKVGIEPFDLLFREIKLVNSFLNPFTHGRAAGLIASGTIRIEPLISRRIGLGEASEAIGNPAPPGEIRALVVPHLS
jgi:threonine dehydrogenase-like Zn-dependent dehydrogenase